MLPRILLVFSASIFAFIVLLTSIFRTASVKYEFPNSERRINPQTLEKDSIQVDYILAYQGKVLPDSILWPLKALRDKVWLFLTTDELRRAELLLLFADKRLASSKVLFEKGKADIGLTTLTKSEKYLEKALNQEKENQKKGIDTQNFLQRLAKASLKHYQVLQEILDIAPEAARPKIIETQNYAKKVYQEARNSIFDKGGIPPENPFDWN
ncbi:hypothetical protein A2686_01415 [Candidatus Woesebacteria bacterium RIFCSPHIGHO2_01_FULL_38_10]|uniref:DUF5667 domain-containing protein n=1 Tax=Candidatus Woesebacteria bacterium RIFCSPLOWO2_01_FULL_39_10b TaxID=1802517 RepID=A0A1F8B952_9BACT|nr:MAG: hypothetical protein A2686_01415 [Candidatus Woesebacteria bacterium RIFCSPHIGHO2_01_FULL_38_10]OGM59935.1 MAG: hypothetical protein A2892_05235 [Candidatus Woesebacteria bacterium RIFCSPLOWO2_01_FULL_39_10b]